MASNESQGSVRERAPARKGRPVPARKKAFPRLRIRRNIATVSQEERDRFRDAIIQLDTAFAYPDGVSYWDKQDEIHQATHVHGGPAFIPWHRELCNRFEALLREVDPSLSLHYWDWTTDPRASPDGKGGFVNLFSTGPDGFMGSSSGIAGSPLDDFDVFRAVLDGAPAVASDAAIVATGNSAPKGEQFPLFRQALESAHNSVHGYIGGTIGFGHTAFEDPFVFLLHSNVDRLWSCWQNAPGRGWRHSPSQVYGNEGSSPAILENMEPWAGASGLRPWAPPENEQVAKSAKHPSVVKPTLYDKCPLPLFELVDPDRWAAVIRILFGVTQDGGGMGIGPSGEPIPIDPCGPLRQLGGAQHDVLSALAIGELARLIVHAESRSSVERAAAAVLHKAVEELAANLENGNGSGR
jgi:hypothetical protein